MDDKAKIALGLEEAAERLSIGNSLMRRLVAEDEIPSIKVAGRTLVPVKALEAYALGKLDPAVLAMCARVEGVAGSDTQAASKTRKEAA